ncbi:Mucin-associated surface protein (MASP) [Trypanosoma cruzi]|uniref:Mucin-associated surface protein (MASP), putative n=2 Tax=Trypanosoma cruzi TaxID=5693 RepID=Q4DVE9_TRYCC|nr:mucin-associated surface protein (MASP), putative [Trypanosoma cruzi]EAN96503.1 mucin-associated surface protein (MASP), putative [Trypanosoma cruzi]PWU89937.1 Mucin-associated surface protein (MASP) [Trypanosoma cruzi]RNC36479.1 mucin-associated surface protein (MASP) [Trypanosoma cruzi]|eukprot:XP_818354.1 mucin-associated surface protein (MASP) [Trypanosoma cruzi strain CL Brener]
MAMTMTGRVLLVCALCVLWCGLAGIAADFVGSANGSAGEYWGSWWITQLRRECAEEVIRRTGGRTNVSAVEECVRQGIDGVRAVLDGRRRWGPQRSAVVVVAAEDGKDTVKNGDSSERSFLSEQSSQAGRVLPSGGGGSGSLPGGEGGTGQNPPPPHSPSTGPSPPNLPEKQASAAEEEEGVKSDPKDNENKPGESLKGRETPIDNQNTQNPEETTTGKKLHDEGNKNKQLLQGDNQPLKVEEIAPRKPIEEPPREKEDVDEPDAGATERNSIESHLEATRNHAEKPLAGSEHVDKENYDQKEEKEKKREEQGDAHVQQQNGKHETLHGLPIEAGTTRGSLANPPPEELQQKQTSAGSTKQLEGEAPFINAESKSNGHNDLSLPSVPTRAGVAATHEAAKGNAEVQNNAESTETAVNNKDDPNENLTENDKESAKDKNALRTNATANTGDSDGSTAVSHTTSPFLPPLLVVACAAAAVVAA